MNTATPKKTSVKEQTVIPVALWVKMENARKSQPNPPSKSAFIAEAIEYYVTEPGEIDG